MKNTTKKNRKEIIKYISKEIIETAILFLRANLKATIGMTCIFIIQNAFEKVGKEISPIQLHMLAIGMIIWVMDDFLKKWRKLDELQKTNTKK